MAIATAATLKALFPEFVGVADDVVELFIASALREINEDSWGERAIDAELALTCHKMVTAGVANPNQSGGGGASGPIQSVKVGEVSVSYGATAALAVQLQGLDPGLAGSKYGIEYARLVKGMAYGTEVI